jgi:hypothetical protein
MIAEGEFFIQNQLCRGQCLDGDAADPQGHSAVMICGSVAREASTALQQMLGRLIALWPTLRDASPPSTNQYFFFFACERHPLACVTFTKRNFTGRRFFMLLVDNSHNHFIAYPCCQSPPRSR